MVAVIKEDLVDSSLYKEEIFEKVLNSLKEEFKTIIFVYGGQNIRFKIYRG